MNSPEFFSFTTKKTIRIDMSLHRATKNRKKTTIIYFHGGGLLYGVRDDLPAIYINKFLNAGYDLLALDYLLAPESKLDSILEASFEMISFYLENSDHVLGLKNDQYIVFGRSAGAYLCFMLCDRFQKRNFPLPLAIISLYGYARLDEVEFNVPNKHYNKLAKIPNEAIEKIISDGPITSGPMNLRFSLYIKVRQEGSWIKYLCGKEDPAHYSLNNETLKSFPPTILAAATLDPDVPYRISKTLSKTIPNARLITLYKEDHDFDRTITDDAGKSTYDEIIAWLAKIK